MKILEALQNYKTDYEEEKPFIQETIDLIQNSKNPFDRSNTIGHVTGSAWLLNSDGTEVLLTHHKKLNRWLQLGGHSDGSNDTWAVALREAQEESGIEEIEFVNNGIIDIDVQIIPENIKKAEPQHKHYDIRFLLKAKNNNYIMSDESNALKWFDNSEVTKLYKDGAINSSMYRLFEKAQKNK